MKNTMTLIMLAAAVAGCASNNAYKSTPQTYRAPGAEKPLHIEAALLTKNQILEDSSAVLFRVDNVTRLGFNLDKNGNGQFSCDQKTDLAADNTHLCAPLDNHLIAATCYGSTKNYRLSAVNCAFTIDNEIAANFRF